MDKIAVLIPCYNESQTIEKVVRDWRKELPEAVIYVYDNNSTDDSTKKIKQYEKKVNISFWKINEKYNGA